MDELTKYEVYKMATNDNTESYIFSVETFDGDKKIIYYLIRFNHKKQPIIERINNAFALLSSNNIAINKLKPEEYPRFISIFEEVKEHTVTSGNPATFTTQLNKEDTQILKLNKELKH